MEAYPSGPVMNAAGAGEVALVVTLTGGESALLRISTSGVVSVVARPCDDLARSAKGGDPAKTALDRPRA